VQTLRRENNFPKSNRPKYDLSHQRDSRLPNVTIYLHSRTYVPAFRSRFVKLSKDKDSEHLGTAAQTNLLFLRHRDKCLCRSVQSRIVSFLMNCEIMLWKSEWFDNNKLWHDVRVISHSRVTDFGEFCLVASDYLWVKFAVWYDFYFSWGLSHFPHDFLFDNRSLQERIQWTEKLSLVDSLVKNAIQLSLFSSNFDIFISFLISFC